MWERLKIASWGVVPATRGDPCYNLIKIKFFMKKIVVFFSPQYLQMHLTRNLFKMIRKPLLDSREYRHISLPNKLEALLISDKSADKAAAAMDVHVGSLFDPPAYQGLAHFLEHMLFLGTSKYPAEDEYQSFLAKHGGMSNAFTADNHTCYFFNVAPDHLEGALDRFGQFFISPLFTQAATDREVNAVHSEHSKNVQDDMWRQYQLMRSVCFHERHPTHHFSTGNKETLGSVPREVLLNFHNAWYSANVSRMSVLGRESLNELQAMVEGMFSQVPNKDVVVPVGFGFGKPGFINSLSAAVEFGHTQLKEGSESSFDSFIPETDVPVVNKAFLNKQLFIVPVKEQRSVQFCWFLPEQRNLWRSKPSKYLSHIFGHEGQGSLTSVLKQRGIATDLVGGLFYDCAGTALFKIDIHLTKPAASNLNNLADIAEIVAAYIRLSREEFSELLWKEVETVDNLSFSFRATVDPMNAVQSAANALHYYPVEEVLAGGTKIYEFDEAAIRDHLAELVPDKMFITTIGKEFEAMCDSTEQYYGTKYGVREIDSGEKVLDRMKRVEEMSLEDFKSICTRLELSMPNPNPFLPANLAVLPPQGSSVAVPSVVFQKDSSSTFFKQDETFEMPKGNVALVIYSPFVSRSLSNYAASDLWLQSLNEEHSQVAYQAEIAGLKYKLKGTLEGVSFSVQGYSDKMKDLILSVVGNIRSFEPNEHLFALVKDRTVKTLQSQLLQKAPYSQGLDLINEVIMSPFYSTGEKLEQVQNTRLEDLKKFSGQNPIFESATVETLIEGNFRESDAIEISQSVVNEIISPNTAGKLVGTVKVMHCESDIELLRRGVNPQETNGAVVVSVQTGWVTSHVDESNKEDLLTAALLSLTSQICGQKFFDDLRTKQQLGYIVHSAGTVQERRAGLLFLVQSEVPTRDVKQKIFDFINNLEATIQSIPEEDFARYIEAVVTENKEKPKNQSEEFQRHWAEIEKRRFDFTRKERLIPVVETITKAQLVEYVREHVIQAPKVIATVTGSGEPEAQETFSNEEIKQLRNSAKWINSNNRPLTVSKL